MRKINRKTIKAYLVKRGNATLIKWTHNRKIYQISLGAELNEFEKEQLCLDINKALSGGSWPEWSLNIPAVDRYMSICGIAINNTVINDDVILKQYKEHVLANSEVEENKGTILSRIRELSRWSDPKPLMAVTASDAMDYLNWIMNTKPIVPGTAADIHPLISSDENGMKVMDILQLYLKTTGKVLCENVRNRIYTALSSRRDLFEKISHGKYRRIDRPTYDGRSAATRNRALSICRVFYAWAIKKGYCKESPFDDIKWLKEPPAKEIVWCTREERDLIINAAEKIKHGLLFKIAFYSGLRLGEIVKLRWVDVNFASRMLLIGSTKDTMTKTRKVRQVPINKTLFDELQKTPINKRQGRVIDMPVNYKDCAESIKKRLKKMIPELKHKIGYNVARHTFCSLLAQTGKVSIDQISAISGHTPVVCRKHYAHLVPADISQTGIDLL